ncbi:hypothetical protein L5515_008075 [Caenorhabditis briggsae]|uniref:Protein CBR-CRM-1 n=1 Tax=Caenorhabditis briggsae TaxID=6238 RepID=A0AAE9F6F1_CAEBR|nr:hypothetical protein L5515_008075 [Caenorhabditis briggsae]
MNWSRCTFVLFSLFIVLNAKTQKTPLCGSCDKDSCPDVSGCDLIKVDQCDCCKICVRQVGETCGEPGLVCDSHLSCHQDSDLDGSSRCKERMHDECLKANCPLYFHKGCPPDSQLITESSTPGNCCQKPGTCHCDQKKCVPSVPTCTKEERLVMVEKGSDTPGKCCAVYECQKKEKKCDNVICPPIIQDEEPCPSDSFRPPDMIPKEGCCPVRQACKCRGSICRPAQCPNKKVISVIKKGTGYPGRCCDEWDCIVGESKATCKHNNIERQPMETWHANDCETCQCLRGVSVCSKMACPKVNQECTWIGIPTGECCPVCLGCQTENQTKLERGDTWQKDDCTSCTCSELGAHMCEKYMCKTDFCDEPTIIRPPATCPSLELCSLRCANGLRRDNIGCYVCECLPDEVPTNPRCRELNDENCEKQCAHGYLKDEDGCTVCKCSKCPPLHQCHKHCLYGFETNSAGCSLCKCRASSKLDKKPSTTKSMKPGAGSLQQTEYHSEKCISFSNDGHQIVRDGGEWWSDGCRHCFCENKQEFCSLISCPSKPSDCADENWVQKEEECCPSCTDQKKKPKSSNSLAAQKHEHTVCQSPGTGRLFTDGETWQLAPCVSCTCRVGHVLCRTTECPPIACPNPEYENEDDCCPVCPEQKVVNTKNDKGDTIVCTDDSGTAHILYTITGSSWRQDDCTSCVCSAEGSADCYKEACDDSLECRGNPLVIKGKCCPVCSDALSTSAVCSYQSSVYSIGEQWQDGRCSNCSCVTGGQTVCRQMVCPHCDDPVPIEGHCCPLCKDAKWGPYGYGNGSGAFPTSLGPKIDDGSGSSATSLIVVSLMSLSVVALIIVFMLLYKWSRKSNKLHKFNEVGQIASGGTSTVRLSASKTIGSMPRLVDWKDTRDESGEEFLKATANHIRHDSHNSDDQSDSLLSTMSDTSTAPSTISSSGHVPISDTQPLTPKHRYPV